MYLVIKCGGSVFENLPDSFYDDVVKMSKSGIYQPIIVHGGGPSINALLKALQIETKFINGLRYTDEATLNVVEMVLSGSVNKAVVSRLVSKGGKAFGLSGVDGNLITAVQKDQALGLVGEVTDVNVEMIESLCGKGYIPVISPIGTDEAGQHYNINGDIAAAAIAKALGAKLCMVSDIPGIMVNKQVCDQITMDEVLQLIDNGTIYGGMIPKVQAAIDGLRHKVPAVVIINGLEEHSLLSFAEGKKIGTNLVLSREAIYA